MSEQGARIPIPVAIVAQVEAARGGVRREDGAAVLEELGRLGVRPDTQLMSFFQRYQVTSLVSTASSEELMDPLSPNRQLARATRFVRETWRVPENFVCLTSCEGEGAYLYEVVTEAVYDFTLGQTENLARGQLAPRWSGFFEFIAWYLGPAV